MNKKHLVVFGIWGFFGAACAAYPISLHAQAPAGPLPQADSQQAPPQTPARHKELQAPRKNILGFWALNRDESDDPRKKLQDARGANGNGGGNSGGRRSNGGIRFPGGGIGGGGPYGGRRAGNGGGQNGQQSDENREKIRALLTPSGSLSFAQTGPEVDLTDENYRKLVFYTDGRKIEKSKDQSRQEIAAHWDASKLVSEEKSPQGGKLTRTFELSADGQQLSEIVSMENSRSKFPFTLRYVYDAAKQE